MNLPVVFRSFEFVDVKKRFSGMPMPLHEKRTNGVSKPRSFLIPDDGAPHFGTLANKWLGVTNV
jgi:hypothetical protein